MHIYISSNKPLPIRKIEHVMIHRGKIKPYFLQHGFFVEIQSLADVDLPILEQYIDEIVCQYKDCQIHLHATSPKVYRYFLRREGFYKYSCGSLYINC